MNNKINAILLLYFIIFFSYCTNKSAEPILFETLDSSKTNIQFKNQLTPSEDFNMFHYMYYYNGAGIGAGDFNNDGLIDLFFAGNEVTNKIYLNKGQLKFEDITQQSQIPQDIAWNTGVSVVDINHDGLLDIYICRVGNYEKLKSKNQLLICTGIKNKIPTYEDQAEKYGLAFSGFSTQALFFDYDKDGYLDMFLLNHSVHQNGVFAPRKNFEGTFDTLSGDRLYHNNHGYFEDFTKKSKIRSTAISYGLGVVASDINVDGYPDIYNGNDFHENDYLYINQKNGTFHDLSNQQMMHTSQYTMGVDIADINNDGLPEIVTMDMLPFDPYILKRSLGEDDYDIYKFKINVGYDYQYTRNNLQWNRGNNHFSEIGMLSGVYASDWSWATFITDFNNDGLKDLFIANGIPKRMNDIDYVSFIGAKQYQEKIKDNKISKKDMALVDKYPEIKIPNKFYINKGNFKFEDAESQIANNPNTYSNGAIYADLDNDGDEDIVVNNVNDPILIYENKTNVQPNNQFISIKLTEDSYNTNAIGAKIILFNKSEIRTYENYPVRGFLSSMQKPILIGLKKSSIDSAIIIWDDNTYQKLDIQNNINKFLEIKKQKKLPKFDYNLLKPKIKKSNYTFKDITKETKLIFKHVENNFNEFNREQLLPHFNSTFGPALAVADVNSDGLEDVYLGGARGNPSILFLQQQDGSFKASKTNFKKDANFEDVDAQFADMNNDGFVDLVIASGGNEYFGSDKHLISSVFYNDGKGNFTEVLNAIQTYTNAKVLRIEDLNHDGWNDIFIGEKTVPFNYGKPANGYFLINNQHNQWLDKTNTIAPSFTNIGLITDVQFVDMNRDKNKDIVVSYEWGPIDLFIYQNNKYIKQDPLTTKKGWWNFILPIDLNKDGNIDFIAGNNGLNSRLKPTPKEPIHLYINDFDKNGQSEAVLTYFLNHKEITFSNKDELQRQLPIIKKKFLYAEDFAKASLQEIFGADKLKEAKVLTSDYFENSLLLNDGKNKFLTNALPFETQISAYYCALAINNSNSKLPDILLFGNFYDNNIQMSRYDADYGTMLTNKGNHQFEVNQINGLNIKGQVRTIKAITIKGKKAFILGKNNDALQVIQILNE